ncbi:MAG: tetratricopeptide repeat protein, partial [Saprospiraceae bacterium]|nr:tetratricopeptide repeat protein [Saprospiraceae bacterium]
MSIVLSGQSSVDSLLSELDDQQSQASRMSVFLQLSEVTYAQTLELSLAYADSAAQIARELGDETGIAKSQFQRGYALIELGDHSAAILAGKQASRIYRLQKDSVALARVNNLLGIIYLRIDSTEKALSLLFESSGLAEKIGNYALAASSYNNIGEIYNYASDLETARIYYKKALDNILKTDENYKKTIVLMNYANMQDSWHEKVALLEKVVTLAKEGPYPKSLTYALASLGDCYGVDSSQYHIAISFYQEALKNAQLSGDHRMEVHNLLYAASCWLALEQIDSARFYLDAINVTNLEDNYLRNYNYYLAKLKYAEGNKDNAFILLDSTLKMHRKYYDTELASQISEANAKFESEKRESEIFRQQLLIEREKRNRNNIIFISVGLMGIIILFGQLLLARYRKKRREAELALKWQEEQVRSLREISETKERIFNNLSHELKTPLTMVIGPLENTAGQIKDFRVKEHIDLALTNSKKLGALVNEILDLAKLDQGKLPVYKDTIMAREFLLRVFGAFSSLAATQYIALAHNINECPQIYMETDREKLEKIFNNLILNALKFSPSGGEVKLELNVVRLAAGTLEVSIIDEGIGIQEPKRIFERYYQGSETISGSGIGLSLVKEYCELLGGNVIVESVAGKGSRFTIEVPVRLVAEEHVRDGSNSDSDHAEKILAAEATMSGDILIVEDDPSMAKYLKKLLSVNYNCRLAFNGSQALTFLDTHHCDLIISDVMMPEMD